MDLLNQLDFIWNLSGTKWIEMYQKLKEYYNEYHHCKVPQKYKENPQLGGMG